MVSNQAAVRLSVWWQQQQQVKNMRRRRRRRRGGGSVTQSKGEGVLTDSL